MELRVHGGPALLFPSFRETLCWEQFLCAVNQLLLLRSTGLGSDFGPRWNERGVVRGCGSLDLLARVAVSKPSSL